MKARWTKKAEDSLYAIGDYIALDDVEAAVRWVMKLRDRAARAATMPRSGRVVPEVQRDDIREVLVGAYRIIYRVEARGILVLLVVEGHHLLPDGVDED